MAWLFCCYSKQPEMTNNDHEPRTDHEDEKDEIKITKKPFLELERHAKAANERLRVFLMGLSKTDMIDRINQLELSDKSLNFLCEGIALEKEDYEICTAVEEIKKHRLLHPTRDSNDHVNYTSL